MVDRKKFFDGIRHGPFSGKLGALTVLNCNAILDEFERREMKDLRSLAYMMATSLGECGQDMHPVREGFAKTDTAARAYVERKGYKYAAVVNGHVYYGRGRVQLTWERNYIAMGKILGIDLRGDPDKALDPAISAQIMFEGMIRGTFTGKKLGDYFNSKLTDPVNARRIINKLDRASEIAGYWKQFYADLQIASA